MTNKKKLENKFGHKCKRIHPINGGKCSYTDCGHYNTKYPFNCDQPSFENYMKLRLDF